MQWARANGCPWGAWSSSDCVRYCESQRRSLAVFDTMLWAHAAGCPCDSWMHYLLTRVKYGNKYAAVHSSSSSSSGGGSSSSGNSTSSSSSSVSTPQRWRCDALLFEEFFCFNAPTRLKLYIVVPLFGLTWAVTQLVMHLTGSAIAASVVQHIGMIIFLAIACMLFPWMTYLAYFQHRYIWFR
jgi:hypothetical protein